MNETVSRSKKGGSLSKRSIHVRDEDVFILNPLFRLRNDHRTIKMFGFEGIGSYDLHPSHGLVAVLCNGKRTVREVAESLASHMEEGHTETVKRKALEHVRKVLRSFLRTNEEVMGEEAPWMDVPSTAPIIPLSFLPVFGGLRPPEYDADRFQPSDTEEAIDGDALGRERVPAVIKWHLTYRCPVNCRYCYLPRPKDLIPLDLTRVLEIVNECNDIGVFSIFPTGGDVLMYEHIFEFLDAMSNFPFLPVRLTTKASVDLERAKRLAVYHQIYALQFSVDSNVEDVADYMTHTPGFYRRMIASIDNAVAAGLKVGVKAVISPYNILTIPDLYREMRRRGVSYVHLALYKRKRLQHSDDMFNSAESFAWLEEKLKSLEEEFDTVIHVENAPPDCHPLSRQEIERRWKDRVKCEAGRLSILVCPDGKVLPCEHMPINDQTICGDLKRQSLREVWDSMDLLRKTMLLPREEFKGTLCYDCRDFADCIGKKGICIRDTTVFCGRMCATPPDCPRNWEKYLRKQ